MQPLVLTHEAHALVAQDSPHAAVVGARSVGVLSVKPTIWRQDTEAAIAAAVAERTIAVAPKRIARTRRYHRAVERGSARPASDP